jgi:hypothetical protein
LQKYEKKRNEQKRIIKVWAVVHKLINFARKIRVLMEKVPKIDGNIYQAREKQLAAKIGTKISCLEIPKISP